MRTLIKNAVDAVRRWLLIKIAGDWAVILNSRVGGEQAWFIPDGQRWFANNSTFHAPIQRQERQP